MTHIYKFKLLKRRVASLLLTNVQQHVINSLREDVGAKHKTSEGILLTGCVIYLLYVNSFYVLLVVIKHAYTHSYVVCAPTRTHSHSRARQRVKVSCTCADRDIQCRWRTKTTCHHKTRGVQTRLFSAHALISTRKIRYRCIGLCM